jgi:hypothetical protein
LMGLGTRERCLSCRIAKPNIDELQRAATEMIHMANSGQIARSWPYGKDRALLRATTTTANCRPSQCRGRLVKCCATLYELPIGIRVWWCRRLITDGVVNCAVADRPLTL